MCGVTGIYTKDNINDKIYYNLLEIQHRGQDCYGYSDGNIIEKYMGLIRIKPKKLKNNIAIAHTRYCTSGEINERTIQPISKNGITLVHNGNIHLKHNYSDTYALLDFIVDNLKDDIIAIIKYAITYIEGSFFVLLIYKNCLYAFKDKNGIRPGCYGRKNNDIIFSPANTKNSFVFQRVNSPLNF